MFERRKKATVFLFLGKKKQDRQIPFPDIKVISAF